MTKMGRIKTTLVKRNAMKMFKGNTAKIKTDFNENKEVVEELAEVRSKKLRNIIAGYLTRLKKRSSKDLKLE